MSKNINKYCAIFIADLLKEPLIFALMSINQFGLIIGLMIYTFDFFALVKSIVNRDIPELLIGLIITYIEQEK